MVLTGGPTWEDVGVIVVAGEALVDVVVDHHGDVAAALGGAPFNTARTCGRLGVEVGFVGTLSRDRFGSMLARQLELDGVITDHVVRIDVPTTLAVADLDEGGAATYGFYIQGTSAPALSVTPADLEPDIVFSGGLGLVLEPMAETVEMMLVARDDDAMVMIDVNCRPKVIPDRASYLARLERVMSHTDVVKVSDEDLAYLAPGMPAMIAARALLDRGPQAVLLTAGASAVHVLTRVHEVRVPVDPVEVVDTIGAGDSFGGGFLSWWHLNGFGAAELDSIERLSAGVEAANVVAALVCRRRGADPPWRAELPTDWSP